MTTVKFKVMREIALNSWRERTKRTPEIAGFSAFVDAYECQWQEKHAGEYHNNFFCSLGEFATNIDDLLEDQRFDDIDINEDCSVEYENSGKLYRYYCRFLLVSEQIIEDFETALKLKKDDDWKPVQLKKFVNWIIKHRSDGPFHFNRTNEHLEFLFGGIHPDIEDESILNFENYAKENYDITKIVAILMPPLETIIDILIMCYMRLDQRLNDETFRNELNRSFCREPEETS